MTRECQVRICEGLGVKFPGPTRLGCAKTKSDLVLMPSGRQVFAFFCSAPDHRPQDSGCSHTAQRFHTAWVKGGGTKDARRSSDKLSITDDLLHRNILRFVPKKHRPVPLTSHAFGTRDNIASAGIEASP